MNCRELEDRLEALLDGELSEHERQGCDHHLAGCPRCRQLVEPFAAAVGEPPEGFVGSVLTATSGSPCGRAEGLLCSWLDSELTGTDRQLVAAHLDSCERCRVLAAAMTRLSVDLPRLAELRPDPGFVEAVLAATLPVTVRLRRWRAAVWPQWVRRPRFASEAAFVATMVLVLVFATPGSPLEAVPNRALVLMRSDPAARIEARLEGPFTTLEERFASWVTRPLGACYDRGEAEARAWAKAAETRGRSLAAQIGAWLGTCRERLASLLESAIDKASDSEDSSSNPTQEKP